ncbi:MAG TPA: hypothetical protein VGO03_21600 [Acidimicrobiia bacterium]
MARSRALFGFAAILLCGAPLLAVPAQAGGAASPSAQSTVRFTCANSRLPCLEVKNSDDVFGHYVGHDEPSLLFYSKMPGSGNRTQYSGVIPSDPSASNPMSKSYNFELYPTIWFGMAMCDTHSYPLTNKTCTPDSDSNITPSTSQRHAGTAFTELQFYPPGWVQQFNGPSCSATKWCVALTIDSLAVSNVTGKPINPTCQAQGLVSEEPTNFAYLTHSGTPQGPPDPVHFDFVKSGRPSPTKALFLGAGDHYTVTMHDSANGLVTEVDDTTTGQKGSMTASAANGFAQMNYAPAPSKQCTDTPYNFHPMYSTSQPDKTVVPWAVHTYNIAIDTEIGHFDYCSAVSQPGGNCTGTENGRKPDFDDTACFPASFALLVKVGGCEGANEGFDGPSYLADWPNGSASRPGPALLTSPRTGASFGTPYAQVAFESDAPAIEDHADSPPNNCNIATGGGCTRIPLADYHGPATFYPYYSSGSALGGCAWTVGQDVPGFSTNDYGKVGQYGPLLFSTFNSGGQVQRASFDFRNILPNNPCP